ncbi:MAG: hypothetical protein Q8903_05625, partial [Bacteroidota bacterium]|nr:hypothetical protein [Bacteroidota bacterium]
MENNKIKKLIYKSLDGILSEKEERMLNEELQSSVEARLMYDEIAGIRKAVQNIEPEPFKPFFEERLLDKINNPQVIEGNNSGWTESLTKSFRQIAFTTVIILALLVLYNVNQGNYSSFE